MPTAIVCICVHGHLCIIIITVSAFIHFIVVKIVCLTMVSLCSLGSRNWTLLQLV